ncbi:MAG: hypothetical protein A3G59_02860 [Candidatus Taylorbacteria bacterium RIFCSPLOWO2_12_FULL_47_20]|uniref:Methyltransferase type 11 domain-containing protein n=2 Tax=Candidatus Tayloriibacteriota TaxID=1817919 RepID=A0A1G2PAD1_9BACT|nr:MAG: hypothetical protein A3H68_00660 [Candidatus Taylorbacteria bacterium RIFCSPLOWO2_02_FULL_46_40]OHA44561.1 MAG: hypothetical protein A3G59_02860 [Candidatus Taylorbacteria bacterium RIFCSPLOWO2_12_FULL_47_20]
MTLLEMTPVQNILICPKCQRNLQPQKNALTCRLCNHRFETKNGVLDLRPQSYDKKSETDWLRHWSGDSQQSFSQRFFSFYRKAVFARTVSYYFERFFPKRGVFVEAGSGTSESSERIDKKNGDRTLIAADIVLPILDHCHPIMDIKICCDIFRLPFADNSLNGIWNLGVMEHFIDSQIDAILREFRRVLAPGARVILFWPGTNSLPQKILRLLEKLINFRGKNRDFKFHPDEISQLKSAKQGYDILRRNGFEPKFVDYGFRSLMAFRTLVGEKKE